MHTRNISFALDRKNIQSKKLLEHIQDYFRDNKLEALRFAVVKANRQKVFVEAIVMERGI